MDLSCHLISSHLIITINLTSSDWLTPQVEMNRMLDRNRPKFVKFSQQSWLIRDNFDWTATLFPLGPWKKWRNASKMMPQKGHQVWPRPPNPSLEVNTTLLRRGKMMWPVGTCVIFWTQFQSTLRWIQTFFSPSLSLFQAKGTRRSKKTNWRSCHEMWLFSHKIVLMSFFTENWRDPKEV